MVHWSDTAANIHSAETMFQNSAVCYECGLILYSLVVGILQTCYMKVEMELTWAVAKPVATYMSPV